jgi:ABC-type transport system involved in multi-copper enzyme maturation permease subunit
VKQRIIKEFRSLRLPFFGGLAASICVAFFKHVEQMMITAEFVGVFLALSSFTLFACLALIPTLVFGTEFQNRTWPLLLSQPIERSRLWQEKILAGLVAICGIV